MKPYLDDLEQFTLLFSALGHDVSHTGRTNAFEVATLSKLAIKYNDESVWQFNWEFLDVIYYYFLTLGFRKSP